MDFSKGGLISENFSLWFKSPKKGTNWSLKEKNYLGCDLAPFFGDLAKVKNSLRLSYLYYSLS